jgi:hypothetical protein
VPANKVSSQLTGFVNQYTGSNTDPNKPVPVTIGIGGNYANPQTKLLMSEQKQQVKEAATNAIKDEAAKKATELVKSKEAEKLIDKVLGGEKKPGDTTKKADPAAKVKEEAAKKIQSLFKKKNN